MEGYFEKEFVLTPDYCDARAGLSPYGAFTIFQAIATEHAERIGVGGSYSRWSSSRWAGLILSGARTSCRRSTQRPGPSRAMKHPSGASAATA